ncbi:hybrid sensor histidine kinase/response regulator transcription factor [Flavitalea flava]
MKKRTLLILSLFLVPFCFVYPQSKPYYFKNYQTGDGISGNTITCITQDRKGFMWFGTRNGLNRFDGSAFRIFRYSQTDPASLGSNSIVSLHEDQQDQLWIGTHSGIYLFDPAKEKFTPFTSVPAGEIKFIEEDKDHNIWIVADFKLYRFNRSTGRTLSYSPANSAGIVAVHIAQNGTLWIATSAGVIKKYDAGKDLFITYSISASLKKNEFNQIQDIYPLNENEVIVGTNHSALLFDLNTLKAQNLLSQFPWGHDIQIHRIFEQHTNELWLGTETGLYIYNLQTKKTDLIQHEYDNPYSITNNVLYSYYMDKEGGTWIGTFFGGVNYYSPQYNKFQKYFRHHGVDNLSGNLIHEICEDGNGNLWVGTEDAGLNKIDGQNGQIRHFQSRESKGPALASAKGSANGRGSISFNNVHGLVAAGNELWIGTYEHGLDVMDLRTEKVIRHYDAGNDSNSIKSNFIVTLYQTRSKDILVGTWNGLFRYNRKTDNFSALPFFNTQIQAIHEDQQGTIWACTYGYGVSFYNPLTGRSGHLRAGPAHPETGAGREIMSGARRPAGLINDYINNITEDSRKHLWFCTEGGLSEYDPHTGKFSNYTIADGLPDNQVFRILEDEAHQFWASTAKGLVCFNQRMKESKVYTVSSGLLIDQFNYNSAFKRADGTLYFGSIKGMVSFNPSTFTRNLFIPPVYITGLQINNKGLDIHETGSPLQESVTYAQKMTLPYNSSTISLDIAALSYAAPEMNKYAYKMEGLDKEWTQITSNRKIYYTKLPQGDYTFLVKGSNNEGIWNEQEKKLVIRISPPFWATPWAYLLYILILTAIIVIILRYYYIALDEKNKRRIEVLEIGKEREIYNAKIEFFTNVAHEIRTPLTLIKMPLDKLIRNETDTLTLNESLQMINKNTNRLIDLTNQLLDFRKAEASKFSLNFIETNSADILKEVFTSLNPSAEQKNLHYSLDLPRMPLYAFVDAEALKKILTNLINNAIKYADKQVFIRLLPFSSEDNLFHVEIRNDGFLIPPELKEKIFEPFYRIKETEKEEGTGIGLALSRSLAELHKGTLELKQRDGVLNVFLLSLPIHQEKEISFGNYEIPATGPDTSEEKQTVPASGPLILLVEDNREILHFIQKELSRSYNVLMATNGQEALDILIRENVQLVISDIMMPVMDGIELCRRIKNDLQYSHVPIILLTAKNSVVAKIEGLEVGADAYIEKPFNFEHLQAQISNLLTNRNIIKEYFARSPLTHIKGIACSVADRQFLEQLSNAISVHITDMDLDVDRLSKMMNMSRTSLYRKINALSNLTPNELINLTRLKKAAELLAGGEYKINEVARIVGYSLLTNFSRDFHKQFGISPSQYTRNLQSDATGKPS